MTKYAAVIIMALNLVACGKTGPVGANGLKGDQGEVGPQGTVGQDGSNVSVVKLCPGETVYPTVFVEVAFCIDHKLYATYSEKGGFSTELPPGEYSSNAIGSRCNFTVGPECAVSQ